MAEFTAFPPKRINELLLPDLWSFGHDIGVIGALQLDCLPSEEPSDKDKRPDGHKGLFTLFRGLSKGHMSSIEDKGSGEHARAGLSGAIEGSS